MKLWSRVLKDVQVTAKASTIGPQSGEKETAAGNMVPIDIQNRILSNYVLATAESRAAALLSAAQGKSRSMLEKAAEEAKTIKQQAYEEGFARGYREGEQQAQGLKAEAEALLEEARREREEIIRSAEPEIINLALRLAERIVNHQLDLDPSSLLVMLKGIQLGDVQQEIVLRVHPERLSYLKGKKDELCWLFPQANVRVEADPGIKQGFILDTRQGTVDARVGTQLEELELVLKEVLDRGE
jgi:flagellar assembly protein FliH